MRWILVTGTGRQSGLGTELTILAFELGRLLAKKGYGLVVGGWPGVDFMVAQGFAEVMKGNNLPLSDYMIQVIAEKRPVVYPANANYPDYSGGHVIPVPNGVREWIDALKFADAVVLLGGEGGSLETFYYAGQEQRPVFPVAFTGGDASFAYQEIVKHWELFPYRGLTKEKFESILSQTIDSADQIPKLVEGVIELLNLQFAHEDEPQDSIFVSYAHEDRHWLVKLQSALRPLEKRAKLTVWDDMKMYPGTEFKQEISSIISRSKFAVLLISDSFMGSEFIRNNELPLLLEKRKNGSLKLQWLLVEGDLWKTSPLADILSINDTEVPLASLSPAQQQDALVMLRKAVAVTID